jgi:Co/Zn/Cd efflux system component
VASFQLSSVGHLACDLVQVLTVRHHIPSHGSEPTFLSNACKELHEKFEFDHVTLQIDPAEAPAPCALASDESV